MRSPLALALTTLLATLPAALPQARAAAETPATPGGAWLALAAGGQAFEATDGVTLDFADGRVSGRSGCNRYMGEARLTALTPGAGTIALGPVMGTRMACPGRGDTVEAAFLGALSAVDGWQIEADGTLVLTGAGAALIRARPR